ncbi:MAG: response regulator [Desulfobacterales bacterium]|nr:response regulator [Desulfobacterales bacterium]
MAYTPKILVVDDEPRMCDSLKVLLSNEGYETQTGYSGQEALECLAKNDFDLVLLDIIMPDMNGHQIMDHINSQNPETPVIVITGHATVDSAIESLRRGAYDYLRKPFEFEELLKRVKNALDQKRLEKEYKIINGKLKISETRYQYLVNNSPDIIYTLDPEGKFTFAGGAVESLLGYKTGELVGKHYTLIVFEDDIEKAKKHFNETRTGHGPSGGVELRLKSSQNSNNPNTLLTVELKSTGIYDRADEHGDKKFVGTYGVARDIDDRKRAEDALRESEERYRTVLEASPDPVVVYDVDGKVIYLNPAFTQGFGWSLEELLGKKIDYVPEDNWPETQMMIDKVLARECFSGVETRRYTKQGNVLDVTISVATYLDHDGTPLGSVHTLRDITERNRLEAQLQQAAKMESIGTLAGGIAHDFNNLLMGIQGRTSLMFLDIDSDHPHFEHLKGVDDIIESGASLTRQLLGFARGGKYEVKPINANELIEKTSHMFGRTKKEIKIYTSYQPELWTVEVDQGQIEQVLLNLYVNAWHAMPAGGDLYLKTENVVHREEDVRPYGVEPGNYVKISVKDTGVGMDEPTQKRIFEPFFTTKEMGRGIGLGLASAYGIIKNHDGIINVQGKKGEGTVFNIYLPASEKKVTKEKEPGDLPPGDLLRGAETLLLVDDEDMIIDVGQEILREMGYKVILAKSGKEAVEIYEKNKDKIDMVILDMIMPDMGGGAAYDRMKEINPNIKVLLSTGYSMDGKASEILARGCDCFIQKPFSIKQLSQSIRSVLDG